MACASMAFICRRGWQRLPEIQLSSSPSAATPGMQRCWQPICRRSFRDRDILVFHYRGYAPSQGSPSARSLMQDAIAVHDFAAREFSPSRIIALGISIGSGPAAHLARHRTVAGLVLITPFDFASGAGA